MINKERIQRRFKKALGFKSKGKTKVFALKYTGDNSYDVQDFLEQGIFIGPGYSFLKCGQDVIRKGDWIVRYPLTFRTVTLKDNYTICSDRVFKRNYRAWTEELYEEKEVDSGIRRDNRKIGASKSRREKSKHTKSHREMQGEQDIPTKNV